MDRCADANFVLLLELNRHVSHAYVYKYDCVSHSITIP